MFRLHVLARPVLHTIVSSKKWHKGQLKASHDGTSQQPMPKNTYSTSTHSHVIRTMSKDHLAQVDDC
eukprot:776631-Ditylum_brightwellii.AAC.1